ncbi:non-specific serine/threonine protein kinase [Cryptococcus neoformans C23]|uniref:non-specific serine/threonine protein kinase n=1 Tax=Cryptococcus neoformans (strain H99 / ATCC 208821 / CBS 10515 / FGSC 9487) TaxID=235443 RepID=J9VQC8_CRYN9|nr:AGC/NDR protein kinase [Cryptococcus neoformans var. grubii H99]AUB25456.1 AGC/NDR protein kinase [Cryptococcus neoformans var. grubii]OWZ31034.1 non-specific serine/threonine protein kinase [Cryptococcus neoformans var. grubii AD2-60a]OWZ43135.1 non-specific serine/threonine protein kinase [Cryptococcus neoformans var. grubii C23]OXC84216.1 non-specific serine/threonine protein kinase [Cryptococcus neoformans var. grubii AD1-7a]AFR95626.2 AGC/NDR protein kinase [Cryptococcus neoformans var|eukprot:XP_012049816.1 AGC/NDR protein kinase [Cryptococcus neoformans var. grubii H99]
MFSRVLKSTNSQQQPSSQAPASPTKSSRSGHTKSQSTAAPSPSKIPVPSTPSSRSSFFPTGSKENLPAVPPSPSQQNNERSNYLSFLFSQNQAGAPTTPVKVNKAAPSHVAPNPGHAHHCPEIVAQREEKPVYPRDSEDVHMVTMKNTVNPAMLKQLASIPQHNQAASSAPAVAQKQSNPLNSYAAQRGGAYQPDDVHMKTAARHDTRYEKERGLQLWERELLETPDVRRKATVAQIYFLDYYFDLLGYIANRKKRLETFKADTAARNVTGPDYVKELSSYNGRERVLLRKRRTKLRIDQFRIIAQVGQGGYGSVYLARKADTNEICALKKMRKGTLAKMDEVKHVLVERDILTAVKTPWLVRLLYAFQDIEHVYLAMEYVPGGDFRTLLNNSGVLKEEHARFYAAEMFVCVNELHKLGYIHRDLKPENFLVDGTGHVKLTDFGLATGSLNPQKIEEMKSKLDQVKDENLVFRSTLERRTIYRSIRATEPRYADSVVGSPDYMPPEVLRGKTYTYSADYWSLGCILFEFLCGFPPFSGSTPEETWANLKNWTRVLRRPVYDRPEDLIFNLTDVAWDAVTALISHPKDRVASLQEVQSLPFFSSLPFASLRQLEAPFVPVLDGETDVGYFDSFSSPEDMAKYAEVFKKQRDVEAVEERGIGKRNNWVGFTFGKNAHVAVPYRGIKPEGEALQTIF